MSTFHRSSVFTYGSLIFIWSFIFCIYWILFDWLRVRSRWFVVSSVSYVIHIVLNNFEISFWRSTPVYTFLTERWSEHEADMYRTFFIVVTPCTMSRMISVMLLFAVRWNDLREKIFSSSTCTTNVSMSNFRVIERVAHVRWSRLLDFIEKDTYEEISLYDLSSSLQLLLGFQSS